MKIGMYRGRRSNQAQAGKAVKGQAAKAQVKKPQAVSIEIKETDLLAGESVPIMATVEYDRGNRDQKVDWASSNESIVMIEKGTLKAINPGKAMIKAMAVADNGVNQTLVISVTENHVK